MWDVHFLENRDRLLGGVVAACFLATLLTPPRQTAAVIRPLGIDGTMIQAWSSMKSVKPFAGPGDGLPPPGEHRGGLPWRDAPPIVFLQPCVG